MKLFSTSSFTAIALIAWPGFAQSRGDDWLADPDYTLANPNATISEIVSGPDVITEYPGRDNYSSSWEFFKKVGNVEAPKGLEGEDITRFTTSFLSGVTVKNDSDLRTSNDTFEAHSSWAICTALLSLRPDYPTDREVDPSCKGYLPNACLDWLQEYALKGTLCSETSENRQDLNKTPCADITITSDTRILTRAARQLNGMSIDDLTLMIGYSEPDHDRARYYNRNLASVSIIMAGFKRANNRVEFSEDGDRTSELSKRTIPSMFRCLRVNNFTEGSRNLAEAKEAAEKEENTGERLRIGMSLARAIGCVTVAMNMLV